MFLPKEMQYSKEEDEDLDWLDFFSLVYMLCNNDHVGLHEPKKNDVRVLVSRKFYVRPNSL